MDENEVSPSHFLLEFGCSGRYIGTFKERRGNHTPPSPSIPSSTTPFPFTTIDISITPVAPDSAKPNSPL